MPTWMEANGDVLRAYLLGACRDATKSRLHATVRIGQAQEEWLDTISTMLERLGSRSWIYREGKSRRFWVLETTAAFLREGFQLHFTSDPEIQSAFARGYFDSDGGMPRDSSARLYFQYVQKNLDDLQSLRGRLQKLGIACGTIHNPSKRIDPNYWRFYIAARSHFDFMCKVGSWHPVKRRLMEERLNVARAS